MEGENEDYKEVNSNSYESEEKIIWEKGVYGNPSEYLDTQIYGDTIN